MSDDEIARVRAIGAHPDEDTPRLVYADWLDEFGRTEQHRARAEWIRLTCDDRDRPTRKAGERDWLAAHARRLWPRLTGAAAAARVSFRPRCVRLHLKKSAFERPVAVVSLTAERGVTTAASVGFAHAAWLAPVVLADEPLAALNVVCPYWAVHTHRRGLVADHEAFKQFGLDGAYRAIPADDEFGALAKLVLYDADDYANHFDRPTRLINEAVAHWARGAA